MGSAKVYTGTLAVRGLSVTVCFLFLSLRLSLREIAAWMILKSVPPSRASFVLFFICKCVIEFGAYVGARVFESGRNGFKFESERRALREIG